MTRPFKLVDVFGTDPFTGNPLAVIADTEGLSTDDIQCITRWLNLSETTFLLPPTAYRLPPTAYRLPPTAYRLPTRRLITRVRIFTLARELPFAGHPTLGTCHAWLEAGGVPKREATIVQKCGVRLVEFVAMAIVWHLQRLRFSAGACRPSGDRRSGRTPPDRSRCDRRRPVGR